MESAESREPKEPNGADARLRVLVVDDEPPARQRLEDLLAREDAVDRVDSAAGGREAVERIAALRPDLVFLDVQMPGLDGLEVVRAVGAERMPATVFVTAYDQYALRAFELAAVDYLLKPFDDARFRAAFARARELVRLRRVDGLAGRLVALVQGVAGARDAAPPAPSAPVAPVAPLAPGAYAERIAVEVRGRVRVVALDRVEYIAAEGPYARLHADGQAYLIRESLTNLERQLDPRRFVRVHRSAIVQVDRVEALTHRPGGDYAAQLKTGVTLPVSRSRRDALARLLGLRR